MTEPLEALESVVTRGDIGAVERRVCAVVGYLVSQDGEVVLANRAAEELIGVCGAAGKRLSEVVGSFAAQQHDEWVDQWIASGRHTREMGDRHGPVRDYAITITEAEWRSRPAELAIILPSTRSNGGAT